MLAVRQHTARALAQRVGPRHQIGRGAGFGHVRRQLAQRLRQLIGAGIVLGQRGAHRAFQVLHQRVPVARRRPGLERLGPGRLGIRLRLRRRRGVLQRAGHGIDHQRVGLGLPGN
jgi:hypothetical protein